jgi:hypothetical protein
MNYPVWKSNGIDTILVHDMVQNAMLGDSYKVITPEDVVAKRGPGRPKKVE